MIKRVISFFFFSFLLFPFAYSQFNISLTKNNATCPDSSNGSISVSVSGGTVPYTYKWLPDGQTVPTITGILPGNYSLTITDNSGMDSTVTIFLGPSPITVDNEIIEAAICTNNGSISLNIISGGTGAYTFLWNNADTNRILTGIAAGNYSVKVTDANGCKATFSYDVSQGTCTVAPEAFFSPNGDSFNDVWYIANAQYLDNIHLIVFDRWGTRVHEQRGTYIPWDGKSYLGIPVPVAVYYYFFYQDKNDKEKDAVKGSVTIMR